MTKEEWEAYYHGPQTTMIEDIPGHRLLVHHDKIPPSLVIQQELKINGEWQLPEEGSGVVLHPFAFRQLAELLIKKVA